MAERFSDEAREAVYAAIFGRRDVRAFRPEPVPEETLERLLTAAHHAPSVGFMQPWDFIVVRDREVRERVQRDFEQARRAEAKRYDEPLRSKYLSLKLEGILDAPLNLCVTCDPTRGGPKPVLGRGSIPETDVYSTCLAVQNLWLSARAEGLGVGWVSIVSNDALREILGIPRHVVPVAHLCLGYPEDGFPDEPMLQKTGWRDRFVPGAPDPPRSLEQRITGRRVDMSLSERLWEENSDLAQAALGHGFVRGIADGTLSSESFRHYVAQDAYFLEAFARAYALALAHSPDREGIDEFAALISGVLEELRLHAGYAERWNISLTEVEPGEATLVYTEFLLSTAALGSVGHTCAAMTPCMELYSFLGHSLSEEGYAEDNPYAEWIQTYSDPEFDSLISRLEELLDRYGSGDGPELRRVYRRAMSLELGFFEAGLRAGGG